MLRGRILIFFIFICANAIGEEIEKKEFLYTFSENGCLIEHTTKGYKKNIHHSIYFGENENVYDEKIILNRKRKNVYNEFKVSDVRSSSFYTGRKKKEIDIVNEAPISYTFSYKKEIFNSIFSPPIILHFDDTDTVIHKLKIPENHFIKYRFYGSEDNIILTIDSSETEFLIRSIKRNNNSIDCKFLYPHINYSIIPNEYKNSSFRYLGEEYRTIIDTLTPLNNDVKLLVDSLITGCDNDLCRVEKIFNYVRNTFSYIDFENGINAFIPRNSNSVYNNKYGDCKDFGNFLFSSLKYLNIKSNIALSSTLSKVEDLDFPSFSNANHVISLAIIDKDTIYLDATDEYSPFGFPSEHIQGKHVLVIDENSYIKNIKPVKGEMNRIIVKNEFSINESKTSIKTEMILKGYSKSYFSYQLKNKSKDKAYKEVSILLKALFNKEPNSVSISAMKDSMKITANYRLESKFLDYQNRSLYRTSINSSFFDLFTKIKGCGNVYYKYQNNNIKINNIYTFPYNIRGDKDVKQLSENTLSKTIKYTDRVLLMDENSFEEHTKNYNLLEKKLRKPIKYEKY